MCEVFFMNKVFKVIWSEAATHMSLFPKWQKAMELKAALLKNCWQC